MRGLEADANAQARSQFFSALQGGVDIDPHDLEDEGHWLLGMRTMMDLLAGIDPFKRRNPVFRGMLF